MPPYRQPKLILEALRRSSDAAVNCVDRAGDLAALSPLSASSRQWPARPVHLRMGQTLPLTLPVPSGPLTLYVARIGGRDQPTWGASLFEAGEERLSICSRLLTSSTSVAAALFEADAFYARLRSRLGWPVLSALGCVQQRVALQGLIGLGAPLRYTAPGVPGSRQAMRAAQRWALEGAYLVPQRCAGSPLGGELLCFVDYSGEHHSLHLHAWGAVVRDGQGGTEHEASGSLSCAGEAAALEAAHLWTLQTWPTRSVVYFSDALGQHREALGRGLDVRYLPRQDALICRAHAQAQRHFRGLRDGSVPGGF